MPNQRLMDVTDYKPRMTRQQYHSCKQMEATQGKPTQQWMRKALMIAAAGGKDGLLNQKQAAELLGVCDWTLRHYWPSKGLYPPRVTRWGKLVGYDRDELLEWAAEHRLGKAG